MNSFLSKLSFILIFAVLSPLQARALSGEPVEGQILEVETNKSAAGAIVVIGWVGDLSAFAESQTVCVHVLSTTTDAEGHYRFPSWHKKSEISWVRHLRLVITA